MLNRYEAVEQSASSTFHAPVTLRPSSPRRMALAAVAASLLMLVGGCLPLTGDGIHPALSPFVTQESSEPNTAADSFQDPVGARLSTVLGLHSVTVARTESVLPTTSTGTIVNPTGCNVPAESGPLFQRDGLPYRQGLTQRANAPVEIPPTTTNVDTAALLRSHLTSIGDSLTDENERAAEFRNSIRMRADNPLTQGVDETGYQPNLHLTNAHYAYARGLSGAGARIAIDDDAVDILSQEFRGRIATQGARIVYRQLYADNPRLRSIAFRFCDYRQEADLYDCSVWEINAGGDEQLVNEYARHIIEQHDYSHRENSWWIRDTSQSGEYAWYEIPPFFDSIEQPLPGEDGLNPSPDPNDRYTPSEEYHHGTWVAATAAGWNYGIAPGATIVPVTRTITDAWDQRHENTFRINIWESASNGVLTSEQIDTIDQTEANRFRELYANFDIINFSHGISVSPLDPEAFQEEQELADHFPEWWRAVQQIDESTCESDGTGCERVANPVIEVYSAGNDVPYSIEVEELDGSVTEIRVTINNNKLCRYRPRDSALHWCRPSGAPARPYQYESFRGHSIAVMAVNRLGDEAQYSNRCGDLPRNWDATKHGRHYCLAAPGTVNAPNNGWRTNSWTQVEVDGTSFAAPLVAGALALMMQQFTNPSDGSRQMTSVELTRRMLNTANNTDRYANSLIYGAGLLDLQAATAPVGSTNMGTATVTASTTRSYAILPRAYGDVGTRLRNITIATFDSWNAPFFRSAADFVIQTSGREPGTIPSFAPAGPAPAHLTTRALGLTRDRAPEHRSDLILLGHQTGLGVAWSASEWLEFGALADTGSDQGAITAGAFGERIRSGMLWAQYNHEIGLGEKWQGWATASLGAGKPDYADSMLRLSGSTYSAWAAGVRSRDRRWRLSIGQPWRAETGTGTFTYAAGRRLTGEHYYGVQRFSLVPRGRELAVRVQYSRPLGLGNITAAVSGHNDYGHVQSATETRAGIAWRLQW